jgi:hypothetical protein
MAEQLKPMSINPGDPVTSELMASIVANINIINSLANSVVEVTATSTGSGTVSTSTQIIESGRLKVPCTTSGTGTISVTFKKTFSATPNIICSLWQASSANFLKQKYQPVVTSPSATGFTISMLPVGATASGSVYVEWIAASS